MHVDFTFHFWSAIGWLSSSGVGAMFLRYVYKQIRRGVDAFVTMVEQHHEMYGWYSTHVKPKQKANGIGMGVH